MQNRNEYGRARRRAKLYKKALERQRDLMVEAASGHDTVPVGTTSPKVKSENLEKLRQLITGEA